MIVQKATNGFDYVEAEGKDAAVCFLKHRLNVIQTPSPHCPAEVAEKSLSGSLRKYCLPKNIARDQRNRKYNFSPLQANRARYIRVCVNGGLYFWPVSKFLLGLEYKKKVMTRPCDINKLTMSRNYVRLISDVIGPLADFTSKPLREVKRFCLKPLITTTEELRLSRKGH